MPEEPLQSAVDAITRRVREELEAQFVQLNQQHQRELEDVRRASAAEADARWEKRLEEVRGEWTARLEAQLASARAEADDRMSQQAMRLRAEAEQAAIEATTRLRQQLEQKFEQSLQEERDRAAAQLSSEREQLTRARDDLQRSLENTTAEIQALSQQVEELLTARQNLEAALDEARRLHEEARRASDEEHLAREQEARLLTETRQQAESALENERRAREDERREREEERRRRQEEVDRLVASRLELEAALQQERSAREAHAAQVDEVRRQMEAALHDERRRREDEIASLHEARRAAEAALLEQRREREEEAARQQQAAAEAAAARVAERQAQLAAVERLLAATQSMDGARSLSDVLAALLTAASSEAPRVALFVLKGGELRGWRDHGFDGAVASLKLPVTDEGVLGEVIRRGEPVVTAGGAAPSAPDFANLPADAAAIAVPLLVGSQPVAILYADDAARREHEAPASWPEAIQILGRHASVNLAHLTALRAADASRRPAASSRAASAAPGAHPQHGNGPPMADDGASAQRYARLLVSEIKLYNEAAVRIGRQKRDLLVRLKPEIDRARRLYEQRVSASVESRNALFQQELIQTLAGGDPTLLGGPS